LGKETTPQISADRKKISRESTRKTRIIFLIRSCSFAKFAAAFLWLIANGAIGQKPKAKSQEPKAKAEG